MAHYQITLAYDGTDFQGFQRQGKARTVQAEFEVALRYLNWQGRTILAAGRTDTGVHAEGQVVAFELDWAHSAEALGRALNAHLPADIAVKAVRETRPEFHPRYSARSRTYQYSVFCEPERNPLKERFAWRVWPAVDLQILKAAAKLLPGTHDYAAFGSSPRPTGHTIRKVYEASWEPQIEGVLFEICANAFLYHMVRRVVYLQVLAGQNRLDLEDLAQAVQEAKSQSPGLAPPQGLVLKKVRYEPDWQDNLVDYEMGSSNGQPEHLRNNDQS
jgi:tRNA pseudouridine38-40 synthase